jgi:D-glycero-beta-D-manno-heptose-7-phosphate kinase
VLSKLLKDISNARVLVIGDTMLDRYLYGEVDRISPEAPVPVVSVQKTDERLGGAANVARNITALGAQCALLSIVGDDAAADSLAALLKKDKIQGTLLRDKMIETTVKLRVIAQKQQVVRLDFEAPASDEKRARLLDVYSKALKDYDIVIVSDYKKGALDDVAGLINLAKKNDIPVVVDPKGDNYQEYSGADLVTPNQKEFEQVAGRFKDNDDLEARAKAVMKKNNIKGILVTRGGEGMSLIQSETAPLHVSARKREVFDVTGAGDTVIAAIGCACAVKGDMADAVQLANIAAGIVVDKLGAATASADEILAEIGDRE